MSSSPSVLVAGAGPTGLILAIMLLKNGVSVRLIAKESKPRIGSRGAGVQPRTLELYDLLGISTEILKRADPELYRRRMYEMPEGSKVVKELPVVEYVEPTPGMPHTNPVSLSQSVHEEILRGCVHELGGRVEFGTALASLEQTPDHVKVKLVRTDCRGTEEMTEEARFDWLVGADGGNSIVRKQIGLSFLGETKEEEHVLVGDIDVESGIDRKFWHYWIPKSRMVVLRPGEGKSCRLAFTGGPEQWKQTLPTREELIEELYASTGRRDIQYGAVTWLSSFRPSMRMVDKFGVGRVYIAGVLLTFSSDAAHTHSPTGGQGLNSSVQDAINLGWKLALVASGRAPQALLDSYSAERLPIIAEMLHLTTALYEKTAASAGAGDVKAWATASARGGALGMLGVNMRGSPIVLANSDDEDWAVEGGAYGASSEGAKAGYRSPDAPGLVGGDEVKTRLFDVFGPSTHTVLVFGGDAAAHDSLTRALTDWPKGTVQTVVLTRRGKSVDSVESGGKVLKDSDGHAYAGYAQDLNDGQMAVAIVRPDGVIGAVAKGAAEVEQYKKLLFG
ncbi:FAD-binding-3 domain-containing protein [Favolaschia claudopus]|uniref:FAD-binding-3 domain-containing protein n=1 Tax=Favolaschia claudopus TaxID=2862362 RepID=A0AAW0D0D9_9AGAR